MNYLRESSPQLQDSMLDTDGVFPSSFLKEPQFCLRQHCLVKILDIPSSSGGRFGHPGIVVAREV